MVKIAEINGCSIHLLAKERTLIIIEPHAIYFRCTSCGEIKCVHMLVDDPRSLPKMRQCFCNVTPSGGNAPRAGGVAPVAPPPPWLSTSQLISPQLSEALHTADQHFRARLVQRPDDEKK